MMDPTAEYRVLRLSRFGATTHRCKPRRFHRKSTAGCVGCKEKRVKCDEAQPTCVRCQRHGRTCVYPGRSPKESEGDETQGSSSPSAERQMPRDRRQRSSFSLTATKALTEAAFSSLGESKGTTTKQLMQHFLAHAPAILHLNRLPRVLALSKTHPLIRTVILALSASHLQIVSSSDDAGHYDSSPSSSLSSLRVAKYFQQQLTLESYRAALRRPRDQLDAEAVTALVLAATILNTLSFANLEHEVTQGRRHNEGGYISWILFLEREDRKARNGWTSLQLGVVVLLGQFPEHLHSTLPSISDVLFRDTDDREGFAHASTVSQLVPSHWIAVFGLVCRDDDYDGDELEIGGQHGERRVYLAENTQNPYASSAMTLAHLRLLAPDCTAIYQTFQFLSKMQPAFDELLYDRDERALWLLGCWLGLMRRFEGLWWCEGRVLADYLAILAWLEQLEVSGRSEMDHGLWRVMMEELREAPWLSR